MRPLTKTEVLDRKPRENCDISRLYTLFSASRSVSKTQIKCDLASVTVGSPKFEYLTFGISLKTQTP